MKRAVIAATAAALIAGSAVATAANTGGGPDRTRWQPSAEDRAILTDARIAALHTALKLTPDQEKLWPGVETALKSVAKDAAARRQQSRADRQAARQAGTPADPIARMRAAADRMDARAGDLRKIADAATPLYQTLDEAQKNRLNVLIRQNFPGRHGGPHHGPHHGPGPQRG